MKSCQDLGFPNVTDAVSGICNNFGHPVLSDSHGTPTPIRGHGGNLTRVLVYFYNLLFN